tara:strand:- start:3619 stop:4212 length:594 start_codon:yes stop_codon:yes gene_type:complete
MKFFFILLIFVLLQSCSKPKTVLICGDHICINKKEAEQYFEENLSIEVKVIDKKRKKITSLIELNLKDNSKKQREITILEKEETNASIKKLSNKEIRNIKKRIKEKEKRKKIKKPKKEKKVVKKMNGKKKINELETIDKYIKPEETSEKLRKRDNINQNIEVVDVCTILEKCSIDEISKYLLKQGKKKNFPDITIRE